MKQTLIGIEVIALGFALMLASMGVGNFASTLKHWWPVFVIVLGFIQLVNRRKDDWWPFLTTFVGALLLLGTTETIKDFDFWKAFWPAMIIVVGVSLLVQRGRATTANDKGDEDITAIMSDTNSKNISKDFHGCSLTSIMGGIEYDMSQAIIKKEAHIKIFALMSSVELRVPKNVVVKPHAVCLMGGIEDKSATAGKADSPVLYVDGNVYLGGVEIKR